MKLLPIIAIVVFIQSSTSFAQKTFIIAKVNKVAITNLELVDRLNFVIYDSKITIKSEQEKALLSRQILDKMIDEELIRQDAARLKIEADPAEVREIIDEVAKRQKKNATQLRLALMARNLSFEQYAKQIESEILWSRIMGEVLRSKVKVTEAEVREFFEQQNLDVNFKKFLIAEVFIAPSPNAEKLATKLFEELNAGVANFKTVVRQFSSGFSVENDGEIGWVGRSDVDKKVYDAISKLSKEKYSPPLLLGDGYHIFKILDSKVDNKINERDFNLASEVIFRKKLQSLAKGYLMDLKRKGFVEVSL